MRPFYYRPEVSLQRQAQGDLRSRPVWEVVWPFWRGKIIACPSKVADCKQELLR
jgi:hypothetical protein